METTVITTLTVKDVRDLFRDELESFFSRNFSPPAAPEPEKPKDINEAAAFLKLSPNTLYGLTSRKAISFTKKGKKLLFFEADLLNYLAAGKQKSKRDIANEVEDHLGILGQKKVANRENSHK